MENQTALQRQAEHGHTSGESGFSGRRSMAPPAFQLKASSNAPIQRVGEPEAEAKMTQQAGTCGVYALVHSIAWLYDLNKAETQKVRAKMLKAAGKSEETGQGEITSFETAQSIVHIYNKLHPKYKINIEEKGIDATTSDQDQWRENLDVPAETEKDHAATLAIDAAVFSEAVGRGTSEIVEGVETVTLGKLKAKDASEKGAAAHWVTIIDITDEHLVIIESNDPAIRYKVPIADAHILSTSLKAATTGSYLGEIYKDNKKKKNEKGFVKDMGGVWNSDYRQMKSTRGMLFGSAISKSMKKINKQKDVKLNGLAIKVTKMVEV